MNCPKCPRKLLGVISNPTKDPQLQVFLRSGVMGWNRSFSWDRYEMYCVRTSTVDSAALAGGFRLVPYTLNPRSDITTRFLCRTRDDAPVMRTTLAPGILQ